MHKQGLAPNETIQLHELLTIQSLSLTKSVTMFPIISDEELKTIIKNHSKATQQHIRELRKYFDEFGEEGGVYEYDNRESDRAR